jgi:hypothetical protein
MELHRMRNRKSAHRRQPDHVVAGGSRRSGEEEYLIFHHVESQVYLEEGFPNGPLRGPHDEPGR